MDLLLDIAAFIGSHWLTLGLGIALGWWMRSEAEELR